MAQHMSWPARIGLKFALAQGQRLRQIWPMIEQVEQRRPPHRFNAENARHFAAMSTLACKAKREAELAKLAQFDAAPAPASDEARKARVAKQVDVLIGSLEKAKSDEQRLPLVAAIERLWKLVQPTAGVAKVRSQSRPAPPVAM